MKKDKAQKLWRAIENYSDAKSELSGEGNSGEFHNAIEANQMQKEVVEATKRLIYIFAKITGWKPVLVAKEYKQCPYEDWELEKFHVKRNHKEDQKGSQREN